MKNYPKKFKEKLFLFIYSFLWIIFFPLIILYLLKRSIKEPEYRKNLKERFGFYNFSCDKCIWIHAASLGEFRASVPLIEIFIKQNQVIVVTTLTPAGRLEIEKVFKKDILEKKLYVVYLPFEYKKCIKNFFNNFKPKFGIILEIELWPKLISCSCFYGIPIVLAQAQYPKKSFERDKKYFPVRASVVKGFDLILTKSIKHSERFIFFGAKNTQVMGELRFDQPISQIQLKSAKKFKSNIKKTNPNRKIICFGSTGPNEDVKLIKVMREIISYQKRHELDIPFFIYVPRHKKDFDYIENIIKENDFIFMNRIRNFDPNLNCMISDHNFLEYDGLFGNSLGEINFYYSLADMIFIGNSFNKLGCHNIIEPLALKKNVVVGPSIWGIEYPGLEAAEAGVLKIVKSEVELKNYWLDLLNSNKLETLNFSKIETFYNQHAGASERCIEILKNRGFF